MITFFTTPKPFRGLLAVTQRNALQSWKLVHPDAEVIVFGGEEGAEEACRDLGLRHEPGIKRNEHGTKYLTPIFDRAQVLARHDLLCYVNCDIILLSDFRAAFERVAAVPGAFLMAGQRWDTDITVPVDFSAPRWEENLRRLALETNRQRPPQWIDYFAFTRGLYYRNTPPFVIGRPGWDNWLLWHARHSGARLIDASRVVAAIHENHDYSYHPDGEKGVWQGEEAKYNEQFLQGWHFATLEDATHRLTPRGVRRSFRHWLVLCSRAFGVARSAIWFGLLDLTRPVRHHLGLRRGRNEEGRIAPRP